MIECHHLINMRLVIYSNTAVYGGNEYFHMYAYWVCAAWETPIFSPKFLFRSISFSQMTKKSGPEHHHFTFFAVPETIIFKSSLILTVYHLPRPAQPESVRQRPARMPARRVLAVPETRIFTLKTAQARSGAPQFSRSKLLKLGPEPRSFTLKTAQVRSGAPHFHARPWSSFRSPGRFFTLPQHIPTKIWGEYPPSRGVVATLGGSGQESPPLYMIWAHH